MGDFEQNCVRLITLNTELKAENKRLQEAYDYMSKSNAEKAEAADWFEVENEKLKKRLNEVYCKGYDSGYKNALIDDSLAESIKGK